MVAIIPSLSQLSIALVVVVYQKVCQWNLGAFCVRTWSG